MISLHCTCVEAVNWLTGIYSNLSDSASGMNSLCDEIDLSQFCQHVRASLSTAANKDHLQ